MPNPISFVVVGVALLAGCAAKSPKQTPETTLSGRAALSTFPSAPTQVRLVDEAGHASLVAVAADGSFKATLPRGHAYKVTFVAANEVPIVFPRKTGSIDSTFMVKSKGGHLALGSVRYLATAPAGGFKVTATAKAADHDEEVEDDDDATCEDGSKGSHTAVPTSSAPAAADATKQMAVADHDAPSEVDGCENENDDENDGESKD